MSGSHLQSSGKLNRFLERSQPSATYAVIDRVVEKRTLGENIISLCAGEPDFDTPAHISEAAIQAIKYGFTRYTQVAGMKPLRQAALVVSICSWRLRSPTPFSSRRSAIWI